MLSLLKRYDDAVPEFEAALQLDPRSADIFYQYGRSRWAAGDLTAAQKLFERAAELRPDDPNPTSLLASLYEARGMNQAAHAAHADNLARVERALAVNPNQARLIYQGASSAVELGQRERGLEMAGRALEIDTDDPGVWYNVGCMMARMGEREEALKKLARSIELGFAHREWVEHDNDWDNVRDDARFRELLDRMKG